MAAITVEQRAELVALFLTMFGKAPTTLQLARMVTARENGTSLQNIATSASVILEADFALVASMDANAFATYLTNALLASDVPAAARTWATNWVISQVQGNKSKAQVIAEAVQAIQATTNANYASSKAELSADVTATLNAIDNPVVVPVTFTLATTADNVTGTGANDIFNGLIDGTTATLSTLTAADKIVAGGGVDTLVVTTTGGAVANVLGGADISGVEVVNIRNTNATTAGTATVVTAAGLTAVNAVRGSGDVTVTAGLASGASFGIDGTTGGVMTMTYAGSATAAALNVTNAATAGAVTINGTGLTSATVTSSAGTNTLGGVVLPATVTAVTVNAQSNITTGGFTGVGAGTSITVTGAGTANLGTLLATNVTKVDASANSGGVTTTLNNVTGLSFTGGSGNDVVTTGAVLAGAGLVDAGAGTADRLVVAASAHIDATAGKLYKGFEQLQVNDGVTVDVTQLATNNTINAIRISDGAGATGVTNLSADQAAAVSIIAANATGAITIGVKDASVGGQIDTVKARVTTTTALGAAQAMDLSGLTLTGVEKLEVTGTGTVAANTGAITLTTANATSLDSIKFANAANGNAITIDALQSATNLNVDASASSGGVSIDASLYNTSTGATLKGGSSFDAIQGVAARSDNISGGEGNDVLLGGADGTGVITLGTATAIGSITAGFAALTASDVFTGGGGRDMFVIGTNSALATMSSITDLNLGGADAATGVDGITVDLATAGPAVIVTLSETQKTNIGAAASLAAALDLAAAVDTTANAVVQFTYGSDTYLFVNAAAGGSTYVAGTDVAIKITGVSGTLDASDITIV